MKDKITILSTEDLAHFWGGGGSGPGDPPDPPDPPPGG